MDAIRLIEIAILILGFLSVHFYRTPKEIDKDIQIKLADLEQKYQNLYVQVAAQHPVLVERISSLERALSGFMAELKDLRNEFKELRRELHNGNERLRGVA